MYTWKVCPKYKLFADLRFMNTSLTHVWCSLFGPSFYLSYPKIFLQPCHQQVIGRITPMDTCILGDTLRHWSFDNLPLCTSRTSSSSYSQSQSHQIYSTLLSKGVDWTRFKRKIQQNSFGRVGVYGKLRFLFYFFFFPCRYEYLLAFCETRVEKKKNKLAKARKIRSVWKSLGRLSSGSKKFGRKIFLSIFSLNWTILRK